MVDSNPGVWSFPNRALNAPDDSCTFKSTGTPGSYLLYLKTYGFNIPIGATIIRQTIGLKGAYQPVLGISSLSFYVKYLWMGINNIVGVDSGELDYSFFCSETTWRTQDIASLYWMSIAELNNENFTTWITCLLTSGTVLGQVDAVYIEIEYTMPSPSPTIGANSMFGVTMLSIAQAFYRRQHRRRASAIAFDTPEVDRA